MATSFKTFDPGKDSVVTRNLLHEAIPITGTIISGTYADANIKNYGHGMFQSVYDYPFLSSSANHIFDITCGYSATSVLSGSTLRVQNAKKINLYNEMAQVLVGFDENGAIREFDEDGDLTQGTKDKETFFFNFTRLLAKDEIKKGSFNFTMLLSRNLACPLSGAVTLTDLSGTNGYKVNSPAGEYGILYATGSELHPSAVDSAGYVKAGLLYYQAGVMALSCSLFMAYSGGGLLAANCEASLAGLLDGHDFFDQTLSGSTIQTNADCLRTRIQNISFNNTTELNSTVYFCRANNTDFNYSANTTYLSASKMVVKNNSQDLPVSYVTTVGLYSPDNELLAVAKLSEPLKKDPTTEFTIRVRLDY
jgi:hypothetical protein